MTEALFVVAAMALSQLTQTVDEALSRLGAVSFAHGLLLGYLKVWVCKRFLEWCGLPMGWGVVVLVAVLSIAVSLYKIHKTGTRWILALNVGMVAGIIYAGVRLL
ncbi:hypothetical protein dsx2_1199 [Desulfovibrio sp. X2]|uniref:hypothetical protein n=1 Tax=Desulfovibrio sp. X2 TaxID=941449 RepID=UPI000358DE8A|nr:hypothetical protein [Desulfovibrio sp. X2]EPR37256.1 hypothetical protein dsx2_1199 [Desulfovibrio sp. X2]